VVDANVERVVARLFAISGGKAEIRAAAGRITPDARAGDFAQAMMDLGSGVCGSRSAQCLICPLAAFCAGRGRALDFPVKAAKKAKAQRRGAAYWIERDGCVLLVRRADKGMLGGMRALPDDGWAARNDGVALAGKWRLMGAVAHVFTHVALDLDVYAGEPEVLPDGEWWPVARLDEAGLPTLYARAAAVVRSQI
jgi:A/G-specific adenine glycosylase